MRAKKHGTHYLVMEYVDGMDLSRIARLVGPLKIADACALARQVALGLSYAHAEGIVHRDVKPSNLILDNHGQTKILDFGLAQLSLWDEVSAELTSVGQLMGTLDYMAPEQAERSGSVDYRADLYSLGATLFRLLCGRAPLAAAPTLSPLDKLRLLAQHQPPKLNTLRPDAPAKLVAIVSSLLAREPECRPASAAHVAEQLVEFTEDADLNALLAKARTADSQSGNPAELRVRFSELETGSVPAPKSRSAVRNDRNWTRWLAAAVALLLALTVSGAALIVLETQKGQLVIESEVADVHVKLLRDGKTTQDLRVDTGATSTRLAADKYEIVIDSPSDAITIDKNSVVVKRGQTVVARIRIKEEAPSLGKVERHPSLQQSAFNPYSAQNPSQATTVASDEPLYDGKPLETWLTQLARDRSPKAIGDALMAIEAMTNPESADRIRESLTKILPVLDGNLSINVSEKSVNTVNYKGFDILVKATPRRAYFELLAKMLSTADMEWGKRILTSGAYRKAAETEGDYEPLVAWLTTNVLEADKPAENALAWMEPAAWWMRYRLSKDYPPTIESDESVDRIIATLKKCPHLNLEFWLAQPPEANGPPKLRSLVISQAVKAIVETDTSSKHVTESSMTLALAISSQKELTDSQLDQLKEAVQSRLTSIAGNPTRLWQTVEVSPGYTTQRLPHRSPIQLARRGPSQAREVFELLDLAFALKSTPAAALDVAPILKASEPEFQKIDKVFGMLASRSPENLRFISAEWPAMDNFNGQGPFGANQLYSFTGQEWVAYLMYINAADVAGIPLPASAESREPSLRSKR